jgi:radical SAM protein (TIGR01212 family)
MSELPYTDLNSYLRRRFGCRVQKISIDAGLSCPNRDGAIGSGGCIYCNERGSGTGAHGILSITEQIRSAQAALRKRFKKCKFIAYFQSFTNTYWPVEHLRSLYREALAGEDIAGLIIGTRPDCVSDNVLDMIAEFAKETWVTLEYGLQSVHDTTLERINRGHTFEAFRDAVERTRSRGIDVGVHVILGLPGETPENMLETARVLGGMDIQGIKIHLLYVVRGTALHAMYEAGKYRCLTREEYVDIAAEFLGWLPPSIAIHRLTGDPHPEELAAPAWALEKQANLRALQHMLAERGIRQGIYLK